MKKTKADLARENAALRRELEERRMVGERLAACAYNVVGGLRGGMPFSERDISAIERWRVEWDRIERAEESR